MAAKLTILTHKIAIQLHLVAESCIICSSRFRRPVRKLLDTPSYAQASKLASSQKISQQKLCDSSLGIELATSWTIGVLEFDSRRELGIFLFTTASKTALGPTQPPIHWLPGALFLGVKRPGREADHSPPSSDEVKE
jgi:hypothetical protein